MGSMLPKHLFISGLIVAIFATAGIAAARGEEVPDRGDEIADEIFRALNADVFDAVKALDAQMAPLYKQGKYAQALPIVERQLKLQESRLGKEHRNTLATVENLATLYKLLGNYGEAERLFRQSLATCERVYGKEALDTAYAANKLAMLYRAQSRYAEAERLYLRALKIHERGIFKDFAPYEVVANLAVLYQEQGRYREAEQFYRRALDGQERKFGKDDSATLTSVGNLADFLSEQRRYAEAEGL